MNFISRRRKRPDWLLFAAVLAFGRAAAAEPVERVHPDAAALAGQPVTELPAPPAWTGGAIGTAATIEQLKAEFQQATAKPPVINYVRGEFVQPDIRWLQGMVRWFRQLGRPLHMHYEDELFDCDKYSRCFVAFANLLAQKTGGKARPIAVGWVTVFNDRKFAGVEAGGMHAVVIAATSSGLVIIEPQTGTIVPLSEYPNRDRMAAVYL